MKLNAWLTIFWIVVIPISIMTGWVSTVEYVSALSIYALVAAHLSTYAAARVEVKQAEDESAQKLEEIKQTQEEIKQTHKS